MERIGDVLYVGGRFTHVTNGETKIEQAGLAAFNAVTGEWIDTFRPKVNGAVYTLLGSPDGDRLFVGGDFDRLGAVDTGSFIVIDPADASLDPDWSGQLPGSLAVRDFDIDDGWIYVGGGFSWIRSANRAGPTNRLARFDLQTGNHDPSWLPVVKGGDVWGLDVDRASGRIYLAGKFTTVDGKATSNGFASIDLDTQRLTPGMAELAVNATGSRYHHSIDVLATNGRVWVAGSQHSLQILDATTLELETFYLSKDRGDFQALLRVGNTVYVGCHCDLDTTMIRADGIIWWGTPPNGFVNAPILEQTPNSWVNAFDARTGRRNNSFVVPVDSGGAGIWALAEGDNGCVWAGGAVTAQSGIDQHGITQICDEVGADDQRPSPPGRPIAQPSEPNQLVLSWRASTDNVAAVRYQIFDADSADVLFESAGSPATFNGIAQGTYRLYARALDAAGNISWRSGITTVTVTGGPDAERPSTPGRARIVTVGGVPTSLRWVTSQDNVGVAGYRIFDAESRRLIIDTATNSVQLNEIAPGTYRLYVKAYDKAGNQSWRSGFLNLTVDP